ncbi:nose resistant to fluoxetine protein 6 isoform X1 [Solenopsis invicta]|uniref:nose resistant to fluoxetine protein 6 isoform X1 n=1 Tax=Solenopsis invicta TaxID=13686 RepID=UPI00193E0004|nr:nose resistant to fluoxetine protein 6 isoform X1 [Solenopsis invicta]XP_039305524.1 nose resistant to fluoxetine protein 6 isoform X1 [Solenopsis invicta]
MSYQRLMFVLYLCHSVVFCVSYSTQFHGSNENNDIHLLPAYAVASRANLLNSTICRIQLQNFRDAVDQRILWGLKILDSSGSPKPGFLYGNNFWLGSRSQCLDITNRIPFSIAEKQILNNTRYRNPQNEFPPFEVNYIVAHIRHNSTLQYHISTMNLSFVESENIITLGLCLPASCSKNDISFILNRIFRDRTLLINDLYSMDLSLIQVKILKDDLYWLLSGAIPVICIVLVLILMISSTIYDIFIYQKYLLKNKTPISVVEEIEMINSQNAVEEIRMTNLSTPRKESRIREVLICFSIYTNTKSIFNTKINPNGVLVIHGLKFLTMFWIILGHTLLFRMDYIDNKVWALRLSESFFTQVLTNAFLSVDTFFCLSGFLLTYTYLKYKTEKEWNKSFNYGEKLKEFFVNVIRRFIRLTPPYMVMLGIVQLNSAWYDKTSQFYAQEKSHETCAKYWWRNLLYINNLFDFNTMCMSWSWYLACDMQFFIIGLALLILSSIYFYTAVAILSMLLMGSILLSGYISYSNEYVPTLDESTRLIESLYVPPWVRIGPYIIGMITGYIIVRLNKKLILKRNTAILFWTFGAACNISVLFGLYNRKISILSTSIYVALSRTVWAIGIAWIVIVCFTKHGSIVKELLSLKIWIPVSRLTYCAYLLNPFIINSINLHSETSAHVELVPMFATSIGYFGIIYFCAYGLSLMAELPFIRLIQTFIQFQRKNPKAVVALRKCISKQGERLPADKLRGTAGLNDTDDEPMQAEASIDRERTPEDDNDGNQPQCSNNSTILL